MCTDGERVRAVLAVQLPRGTGPPGARRPRTRTGRRSASRCASAARPARAPAARAPGGPPRRRARPAGEREAELLVLVRGRDELVGVRLDAHGDAGSSPAPVAPRSRGHGVEPGDLVRTSRRTTYPTPASTAATSSSIGLVVAVERDPLRREARPQRDRQLATAADVQAQPLVGDPAGDLRAQERLGGVVHRPRAERGGEIRGTRLRKSASSMTNSGVPYRCCEVADVHAGQRDHTVRRRGGRRAATPRGPARRGRRRCPGARPRTRPWCSTPACSGPAGWAFTAVPSYQIRSGALTPSSPSPFASTRRAATPVPAAPGAGP